MGSVGWEDVYARLRHEDRAMVDIDLEAMGTAVIVVMGGIVMRVHPNDVYTLDRSTPA
jgi:hypothetical protein